MHVLAVGLSHLSAPLAIRERLGLSVAASARLLDRLGRSGVAEAVLVVTCGRTELYAAGAPAPDVGLLIDALAETAGEPRAAFEPYLERYADRDAVVHLLRVAAGLEAVVLGETEILGQITRAYERAVDAGAAGTVLGMVFHAAIRAGRRARSETAIGANSVSVPAVAAQLVVRSLEGVADARVVVLGAGETGQLVVRALRSRGEFSLVVMNRTRSRAEELAEAVGATAAPLSELPAVLATADVLITSASAPQPLVSEAMVQRVIEARAGRPFVILDLAVPRGVHPAAANLPGVRYMDVDDLATMARAGFAGRSAAIPHVEAIVADETRRVQEWFRTLPVLPAIKGLHERAEAVRVQELEKLLRRLPPMDQNQRDLLEAMSRSLVSRLLHDPTARLRAEAGSGDGAELAEALQHLFALGEDRAAR